MHRLRSWTPNNGFAKIGPTVWNFVTHSRHSTGQTPPTTLTFERFLVYELRKDVPLPFQFVLSLSSTASSYRNAVNNISFLPLIPAGVYADNDPYRVPIQPGPKGNTHLTSRLYVAIDAIQSINRNTFLPGDRGRISVVEEKEVREKVGAWLGL
jgi:hypothetical protein